VDVGQGNAAWWLYRGANRAGAIGRLAWDRDKNRITYSNPVWILDLRVEAQQGGDIGVMTRGDGRKCVPALDDIESGGVLVNIHHETLGVLLATALGKGRFCPWQQDAGDEGKKGYNNAYADLVAQRNYTC
jgi:hypothetical protein